MSKAWAPYALRHDDFGPADRSSSYSYENDAPPQRLEQTGPGGFEQIAAFIGTSASAKDGWAPDHDLWKDASKYLELRLEPVCSRLELEQICDRAHTEIRRGLKLCESPLERRVLPYLVCQDYQGLESGYASVHVPKTDAFLPPGGVVVVPQMAFMKFRADFGLVAFKKGFRFIVAIECDGKDYHNAEADAARDAYFLSWGIPTVRATGKDVYKQARSIAAQAADALLKLVEAAGE